MTSGQQAELTIRPAVPEDAPVAGRICYEAFDTIGRAHGFPPDFDAPEITIRVLTMMFSSPDFYCVVAENNGKIVGSNCLDERSIVSGVGPITVIPGAQNAGAGRKLMQAVLDRAKEKGAPGVRLVQAAFHTRSLALYTNLGFDLREPLACLQGRTDQRQMAGCGVRPARSADLDACNDLSCRVHGFSRGVALTQAIRQGSAAVVEREGRITGYTSGLAFFGHSTAETNVDLQALIASSESFGGPGILVPMRNSGLFHWCLSNGLRVVQMMTLMSMGLYNDPAGAWLPSIEF